MADTAARPDSAPAVPKVAVVGAGYWGKNLVRNFAELGALAAVVDPDAAAVAALTQAHGGRGLDLEAALADPDVEAVAIAAPAPLHHRLARRALEAGKGVFVEKPVALTLADAEDLVGLAQDKGLPLMVGHLLQYHPVFLALRGLVEQGALGRVRYVYSNRLSLGKVRREEDVLWSFAPHDISMVLSLAGEEPTEIEAWGADLLGAPIADTVNVRLVFPSGARGHVFASWVHPFKEHRLVVVGEDAMAVFDDTQADWSRKLSLYRQPIVMKDGAPVAEKRDPEFVHVEKGEPLKAECGHFLDCVRNGTTPRTDGAEGLRVLRVLTRASEALGR